jgi:hypothetical protein
LPLGANGSTDRPRGEVVEVSDELIGVLNLDSVSVQYVLRKVLGVVRDDHTGLGSYRCSKDVPVSRVRKN